MKPNFALTLSFDGIGLVHRAFSGWHDVGEVALDSPDLDADLAALRDKGLALAKGAMLTKLVVPDTQIKYLTFDGQDASGEALIQAVRDHLDGATPYALNDLAYDWSLEAGQVHVAAVARETLDEAEAFADTHGFNPVSFVARPADGKFIGEPWFGETTHVARHLTDGDSVERDTTPVHIIGPAPTPSETSAPETPNANHIAEDAPDLTVQADVSDSAPKAQTDTAADVSTTAADSAADTPPATFRSIRARRDEDLTVSTPRLDGVARNAPPPDADTPAGLVTGQPKDTMSDTEVADLAASLTASLDADESDTTDDSLAPETAQSSAVSSFFSRRDAKPSTPEPSVPPPPQDEKQRMTIFGARETAAMRGKPRYLGLMLTGVLLLFLLAVAAWASVFMDDGIARLLRGDDSRQIAATPEIVDPSPESPRPAPAAETDPSPDPEPSVSPTAQRPTAAQTPDEARARYAATGIWQIAPKTPTAPDVLTLDDFYQTSIDPQVKSVDAVALPDIAKTVADTRPNTPGRPPAAGTQFRVDKRGIVIATTDGALTPQGVRVYAGSPPLTPPQLPDRPEAVVSDLPTEEVLRLMGVRPRLRPDNLSEQNERGLLGSGGRTRSELASLRPRLRPESAQEAAMAAAQEASASDTDSDAVAAALAEAVQTPPNPFETATAQAVRASLKPNPRPRDFERVVARATQAARSAPVSPSQKVTPSAPTTTTVARAATEKSQISLRQVNLIGVYGTPSDRRALVRLANGRYKKVKVGDNLDGGQVAAIGDGELRYQKSGRNIVLRMPRG